MKRRLLATAVLCLGLLGIASSAAYAATAGPGKPPPKCFRENANGDLPTCTSNGNGNGWTVSYSNSSNNLDPGGGGGIPSAFVALFVILAIGGIGLTVWRVSMARSMAQQAGMDPNQATAVTLLGNEGLDAAYLASSLRGAVANQPAPPAAPATRSASERLAELQQLKDQGLVTAAEYDTQRKAIVDSV